jgi:type IV pilus assembly protein PilY1
MFILDTSGSMTTEQQTINPYDPATEYTGACATDVLYWSDVGITPDCSETNTQWFYKAVWHCVAGDKQLTNIGTYTDTMIMFQPEEWGDDEDFLWYRLRPGAHNYPVECQADSGTHGGGTAGYVYARRGSELDSLSSAYTNSAGSEVAWGSSGRNISYTVYDGNYLNWKAQPATVTMNRTNIMKIVTKKVLSAVDNLNVGIMRFNPTNRYNVYEDVTTDVTTCVDDPVDPINNPQICTTVPVTTTVTTTIEERGVGGAVTLPLVDLETNRQAVLDAVDALPADGWTPLSETMYESALYWQGREADYGALDFAPTNTTALSSQDPVTYEMPAYDVCAKNYNVMLTDGEPTRDTDTPGRLGNLPAFATTVGATACDGNAGDGQCLDDVAQYLSMYDNDGDDSNGEQFVTTHTIGFTIDLPILKETAEDSGGSYFLADDIESLTRTLLSIIANINDLSLSFSAPAVSVNTFNRTQNLNDLYITTFGAKANIHWPGNLKKYRVEDGSIVDSYGIDAVDPLTGFFKTTAHSYWTAGSADGNDVRKGGAAQQLPDPLVRNIYTNNSGTDLTVGTNSVTPSNAVSFTDADFGLTGSSAEPSMDQLIRWMRGEDVLDEDGNLSTTTRKSMGDPLHSQPAAIVYGGTEQSPDVVVYTATNDGYLHAIDGATGQELWAFVPKELLANMTRLYFDPRSKFKNYGLDGNIVPIVKDVDRDGIVESADGDFVQLIFGMRRGGSSYYSLDVTDKNSPELLWHTTLSNSGESWSSPVVARIDISGVTQNADNAVVVIGGGYDTVHDTSAHPAVADGAGAGIHILDLKSGTELWRAGADVAADLELASMTRAFPNEVRVIDMTGDGLADRMYATDIGGNIWRFDVFNNQAPDTLVTGGVIARLGGKGTATPTAADTRRVYTSPDVSLITDNNQQRRYITVSVGSGYRAHPFDLTASDRFYSLRDPDVFTKLTQTQYDDYSVATDADLIEVSGQTQTVVTANDRGWKFTLPGNEKILADSLTFDDQIFFVAFTPDSNAAVTCSAGKGTNFLYRVSAINGDPIVPNIDTLSPLVSDDERKSTLQQGGIAPSPAILFPSPDPDCTGDDCNIPPLGCVGVECFDPGFDNLPVRTLWTQDGIE